MCFVTQMLIGNETQFAASDPTFIPIILPTETVGFDHCNHMDSIFWSFEFDVYGSKKVNNKGQFWLLTLIRSLQIFVYGTIFDSTNLKPKIFVLRVSSQNCKLPSWIYQIGVTINPPLFPFINLYEIRASCRYLNSSK